MHRHCIVPCFLVTSQNVSVQGRGARNRNCYGRKMGRGGGRKLIAKKICIYCREGMVTAKV